MGELKAATDPGFKNGMRDGYPLYALAKRPEMPTDAPRSYGAGMALGGASGIVLGVAPVLALMAKGASVAGGGAGTAVWVATSVWAIAHVPAGLAATMQGAKIAATG